MTEQEQIYSEFFPDCLRVVLFQLLGLFINRVSNLRPLRGGVNVSIRWEEETCHQDHYPTLYEKRLGMFQRQSMKTMLGAQGNRVRQQGITVIGLGLRDARFHTLI